MKAGHIRYILLSAAFIYMMSYATSSVIAQGNYSIQAPASSKQAYPSVDGILSQRIDYIDPQSGTIYYSVERTNTSELWVIVERSPDGMLSRWQDGYEGLYDIGYNQMPTVHFNSGIVGVSDYWSNSYYYNPKDGKVHQGPQYTYSSNGDWGFTMMNTYRYDQTIGQYQLVKSYLLKNTSTGEVEEWMSNTHSSSMYWMPDNKLLVERFSTTANQNEIAIYDPVHKKWTKLMNASIIRYHADLNQMIFTYNEPKRTEHVYDFNKQQLLPEADQMLKDRIRGGRETTQQALRKLEEDLDLSTLPVKSIAMTRDQAHVVHIGDQDIEVPYAIKKDGTLWIPLKPLMEAFGLEVERLHGSNEGYRYSIEGNNARIELTSDNSLMLKENLYVTRGQLQSLGYSNVTITANH